MSAASERNSGTDRWTSEVGSPHESTAKERSSADEVVLSLDLKHMCPKLIITTGVQ